MKRIVAPLVLVLALTGCASATVASSPTAKPTPIPTGSANTQACLDFATFTDDLTAAFGKENDNLKVSTAGLDVQLDAAYLEASGEVAKRIEKVQEELPSEGIYMLYVKPGSYLENAKAVIRACEAEKVDLSLR